MSLFRQNDNTEREHKGGNRPDGFLIGLLLGILLYFLFVSSQDPNFFRGFFSGNEQAFEKASVKLRNRQARMVSFCNEKGLTVRSYRTSVAGYNRETSSEVIKASNRYKKAREEKK